MEQNEKKVKKELTTKQKVIIGLVAFFGGFGLGMLAGYKKSPKDVEYLDTGESDEPEQLD